MEIEMNIARKVSMVGVTALAAALGSAAYAGPAAQPVAAAGTAMSPAPKAAQAQPAPKPAMPSKAMPGNKAAMAPLSHEQVMNIQKALIAKGQPLKADGKWGWKTHEALKNFQKKSGLPATGHPDTKTLEALGITS